MKITGTTENDEGGGEWWINCNVLCLAKITAAGAECAEEPGSQGFGKPLQTLRRTVPH